MVDPILSEPARSGATSVYKYYDRNRVLIYVGVTGAGMTRQRQHNADKQWWPFVAEQSLEHFDSRDDALRREYTLITTFRPPFNKQHNPDHKDICQAYVRMSQTNELTPKSAVRAIKQFAASGRRTINLHPSTTNGETSFLTHVDDYALASVLSGVFDTRVLQMPRGEAVGRLKDVQASAMVARITTHSMKIDGNAIASAVGTLRYVSLRPPVAVGLKSVAITLK
jgi:predicted GIY-YIG superfamily endonuclease